MSKIHVYGDNILECEEALRIIEKAFDAQSELIPSTLFAPTYVVSIPNQNNLQIQLFPGYGRWPYDVQKQMRFMGATLREAPDVIITEVTDDQEIPLIAFEFSGALPAGNNAWQRCGRALGCAMADIPYIYVAELGGVELDKNRREKASRVPNPIIPFAYYTVSQAFRSPSIVSYLPSPTINERHYGFYAEAFGQDELFSILRDVILHNELRKSSSLAILKDKAIIATQRLSQARRSSKNSLSADEWGILSRYDTGSEKAHWIAQRKLPWKKKISIATTKPFKAMQKIFEKYAVGIGSVDLPFALVPTEKRKNLAADLMKIYGESFNRKFSCWIEEEQKSLVVVFIAGFKPRGDDSRPDRGLTPLIRMFFGDDVDVLSIVYGPGKEQMWDQFNEDMWRLAERNGLWEAIVSLSNAILVDSPSYNLPSRGFLVPPSDQAKGYLQIPLQDNVKPLKFGEHDIDTVIHTVFSAVDDGFVYESLCNPPGGNWSGISLLDRLNNVQIRWSSLPRVSGKNLKRPDHIFQINTGADLETLLIVESKERGNAVENKIGQRLIRYVSKLITLAPNISRPENGNWSPRTGRYSKPNFNYVSCAAFEFKDGEELNKVDERAVVDITIGVEFSDSGRVILYVVSENNFEWLDAILKNAQATFGEQIDVKRY